MKKKSLIVDEDEIHLIDLLQIIWENKIKILIITITSLLVGFGYNFQTPDNYISSLSIYPSKDYKIVMIENLKKLVKSNQLNQLNQSNQSNQSDESNQSNQPKYLIQKQFIDELKDYEEFLFSIRNAKKIQEQISKLEIEDQEIKLFKNAKLLEIVEPKKNKEDYNIYFTWHDPDEAKKILKDTLNLVSKNLKNLIDLELLQSLEFEKKLLSFKEKERLDYLKEQSAIAKELNIIDNQVDSVNLSQSSIYLNLNKSDIAYYLRGYKAIDKEIELIKKRKSYKFVNHEMSKFKDTDIKFVDYNIYLIDSKSLKNNKLILMISILLGLIAGVFYVLILNAFQSQTGSKKTR